MNNNLILNNILSILSELIYIIKNNEVDEEILNKCSQMIYDTKNIMNECREGI